MTIPRHLALGFSVVTVLSLAGCGRLFDNVEEKAGLNQSQKDTPENAGVAELVDVTIVPGGKDLAILSLAGIYPAEILKSRSTSNAIVVHVTIRAEKAEYAAVHVRELERISPVSGVYSLESAIGCRYAIGNPGTSRTYLSAVGGSCVNTLAIELPDHEIPRTFFGAKPLFSGEIELADLKRVFGARAHDPELAILLRTYADRLPVAAKPLVVADLGELLAPLADDTKRIDAIAFLAPRVSDPANSADLPAGVFTNAANHVRAVKILSAHR